MNLLFLGSSIYEYERCVRDKTQQLRGLRLRDNGQGRTELKKFVAIEWNVELQRSSSSYHTRDEPFLYVCVLQFSSLFCCLSACCLRARYEFLPTTFEMICCVWAQHPNQRLCNVRGKNNNQIERMCILCKRTHTLKCCSHISQWMKRQWNTNTQ